MRRKVAIAWLSCIGGALLVGLGVFLMRDPSQVLSTAVVALGTTIAVAFLGTVLWALVEVLQDSGRKGKVEEKE